MIEPRRLWITRPEIEASRTRPPAFVVRVPDDDTWTCEECRFVNNVGTGRCLSCGTDDLRWEFKILRPIRRFIRRSLT